jgi:hypothetical protein
LASKRLGSCLNRYIEFNVDVYQGKPCIDGVWEYMLLLEEVLQECVDKGITFTVENEENLKITAPPNRLDAALVTKIEVKKPDIIYWVKSQAYRQLVQRPQGLSPVRLSAAQQRLWLLNQLHGSSAQYNMPTAFRVSGQLDIERVNLVLGEIVKRHEILRTVYEERDGEGVQRVLTEAIFELDRQDLSSLTGPAQDKAMSQWVVKQSLAPFNLSSDLMLRGGYLHLGGCDADATGVLHLNMHHIASDGWSMDILGREFLLFRSFGAIKGL